MRKILIASIFCFVYQGSEGQIWKNIEKKVGKKIEQQADKRLERKIDKTIDKGFNKLEDAAETSTNTDKPSAKNDSKTTKATPTATLADSYSFTLGVSYQIGTANKKDKIQNATIWVSDKEYIGMSTAAQKSMFMVMDEGRMIAFMEDKKTYMSLGSGFASTIMDEAKNQADDVDNTDVKFETIGSESILGYKCDIYKISTSDATSKVWIAPSIEVSGFMKSFAAMSRNSKLPTSGPTKGMMLKMESKDNKSGEVQSIVATEIHKTPKNIKTADYKSMGGF